MHTEFLIVNVGCEDQSWIELAQIVSNGDLVSAGIDIFFFSFAEEFLLEKCGVLFKYVFS